VKSTELPGLSGTVWSIVVLATLLAALAVALYYLYTNPKR